MLAAVRLAMGVVVDIAVYRVGGGPPGQQGYVVAGTYVVEARLAVPLLAREPVSLHGHRGRIGPHLE